MKLKKSLIILMAITLLSTNILSGCNNSNTKIMPKFSSDSSQQKTLTFYFPGVDNPDRRAVLDEIENRTRKTMNIKLDFQYIYASTSEMFVSQLKTIIDSGKPVDGIGMNNSVDWNTTALLAKDDMLMDITTLFPTNAASLYKNYKPEDLKSTTYNNKLIGIPSLYPTSNRPCVAVRQDLIDKYKISNIRSFDDLKELLKTIKSNETVTPMAVFSSTLGLFADYYDYVPFSYNLVYKWNDPNMKLIPWEQTEEYKTVQSTINQWRSSGYIGTNDDATYENIFNGKFGCFLTDLDTAYSNIYPISSDKFKYKIYPLNADKPTVKTVASASIGFNKSSKNAALSLKFMEWIQANQSNYDLFTYGIKDKTYSLQGEKVKFDNKLEPYYSSNGKEAFFNINYSRATIYDDDKFKENYLKNVNLNTKVAKTSGFSITTDSLEDSFTSFRNNDINELDKATYTKGVSSGDIDAFIKDQKNRGVDSSVSEIQKQLDKWNKN
jgi:ABC-type sugar transport system, periplasmic component